MSLTPASPPASPFTSQQDSSSLQRPPNVVVSRIRKKIIEQQCVATLDSLRSHEDMKWISLPETVAQPPSGLVIGTDSTGNEVVAFLSACHKRKDPMAYCSRSQGGTTSTLSQADIANSPLEKPFTGLGGKKLPCLIQWYFLTKGLLGPKPTIDCTEFCKILTIVLRRSEPSLPKPSPAGDSTIVEDSTELEQFGNSYGLRSAGARNPGIRQETSTSPSRVVSLPTPSEEPPSTRKLQQDYTNLARVRQHLTKKGVVDFLRHLLKVEELQWGDDKDSAANKKKLFVGHTSKDRREIFVYLTLLSTGRLETRWYHMIDARRTKKVGVEFVAKQDLIHPFSKTIPEDTSDINPVAGQRLVALVKWYFLSSGHAPTVNIEENKLKCALDYINERMTAFESQAMHSSTGNSSGSTIPARRRSSTPPLEVVTARGSNDELYDPPQASSSSLHQSAFQAPPPHVPNNPPPTSNRLQSSKRPRDEDELDDPQYAKLQECTKKEQILKTRIKSDQGKLKEISEKEESEEFDRRQRREKFERDMAMRRRKFDEEEQEEIQTNTTKHEKEKRVIEERIETNEAERADLRQFIREYYI